MKNYFWGAVIMLGGLFALAAGAQAETGDVVVHIKQDFVAGGKALPAGTYFIQQSISEAIQVLTLRDEQLGTSTLLLPTTHGESRPEQVQVKLTRLGDVYYLSEMATERGVYTLAAPRIVRHTAKASDSGAMSSSGSN
jgi:hypothetical protein